MGASSCMRESSGLPLAAQYASRGWSVVAADVEADQRMEIDRMGAMLANIKELR